jgi:hypothetical protein
MRDDRAVRGIRNGRLSLMGYFEMSVFSTKIAYCYGPKKSYLRLSALKIYLKYL